MQKVASSTPRLFSIGTRIDLCALTHVLLGGSVGDALLAGEI